MKESRKAISSELTHVKSPHAQSTHTKKSQSSSRIRASIKRDAIHPRDFMRYKLPWACEDCSHYNATDSTCTLGYRTEAHRRENLLRMYEASGSMSLCRFLEID